MPQATAEPFSNRLLSLLTASDLGLIRPHLEDVVLSLRLVVEVPNTPITHVHFPIDGIISVVATAARGQKIEAGIIGREGMTGMAVVLDNDRSANETFVQVPGASQRISVEHLRAATQQSPSLHGCFLRYIQTFVLQVAHTALANGRAKIEERLARWLLMAQDRLGRDELALTHEFLALMLGVRRAGVTTTLHELESRALISANRGVVTILDRARLEELANGIYGAPEAEYQRLIEEPSKTRQ